MALWGKVDGAAPASFTSATCDADGVVTGVDTAFLTELKVGDVLVLDSAAAGDGPEEHFIKSIASDTELTLVTAPTGDFTTSAGDVLYREAPKYVNDSDLSTILGADTTETTVAGSKFHAGWIKKHTKTRGGVTSTWYETLVASSSITGDAGIDAGELADA
jgi:predicted metal-dependent phosphotriesterase family hydrolase